jgi:hypothetical protein
VTTPQFSPTRISFVDGVTPIQAWPGSGKTGFSILLNNVDQSNSVFAGYDNNIAVGGTNTLEIPALTSVNMDGARTIYVVAPAGTEDLEVTPGGMNPTSSPVAVAEAMISAGVAEAIAEAISGSGIPLIGTPVLLYNVSSVPPATGGGLVGGSIPSNSYQPTCYNSDLSGPNQFINGDGRFISAVGRSNNGHLSVTKKFWNPSEWNINVTRNDMANYQAFGTKVIVCLQPVITKGLAGGSDFTLVGTAAQKAAAVADKASLAGFLTNLQGMGFTATTAQIVLWQEPGNGSKGVSATDFGNMIKTYGPTVKATIFPLVVNVNYTGAIRRATDYANAALGLRGFANPGVTLDGIAMDWYTNSYIGGLMLTSQDSNGDSIIGIADANLLPFGLNEVGCKVAVGEHTCRQYMTDDPVNSVLSVMQGRLQAGKNNLDVIYFDGLCTADGTGDIASPIGQDPTTPQPDFRAALFDQWWDTLTSTPTTAFTIPATSTVTVAPDNPSPSGGLAQVPYLSYEIALGVSAGAASTNPFLALTFLWYDFDQIPKNQTPIYKETWHIPMGTNADPNGPLIVTGTGRMHGAFLQVKLNNQDSVTCTIAFMQISGTSRIGQRSSLFWYPNAGNSPAVPTFTLAQAVDAGLQLGREQNVTVLAGQTKGFLNGLWAGQAFYRFLVSGAAANGAVHVQLQPQPVGVYGTEDILNTSAGIAGGGNDEHVFNNIALPRGPTQWVVNNNDANTVTVSYQLIGIETS